MRVIITGGTGLIGSNLAESLAADGHEVIVLSRSPDQYTGMFENDVRIEGWDARTADGWGHLADGADAIVNLAGASIAGEGFPPTRWTPARKRLILESRLYAGKAVVEAVRAAEEKPKVVIQSSAVGYYGVRGDEKVTEIALNGDDFLSRVCEKWEASTAEVADMGVRHATVRTGLVLSTEGGAFPIILMPIKMFVGGPLGSGEQYYSWIHIDDVIGALCFLLENEDASGPFNLTAPDPMTNREFVKTVAGVMGRPAFFPTPGFALRTALGEVATVVLDGQRVIPAKLLNMGYEFTYEELEPAVRDLLKGNSHQSVPASQVA